MPRLLAPSAEPVLDELMKGCWAADLPTCLSAAEEVQSRFRCHTRGIGFAPVPCGLAGSLHLTPGYRARTSLARYLRDLLASSPEKGAECLRCSGRHTDRVGRRKALGRRA